MELGRRWLEWESCRRRKPEQTLGVQRGAQPEQTPEEQLVAQLVQYHTERLGSWLAGQSCRSQIEESKGQCQSGQREKL